MAELVDKARPESSATGSHRVLTLDDGDLALAFQFEQAPGGVGGFQVVVFGLDPMGPVVISDVEITLGRSWEIRTSGLWAEQVCERAFAHWSYGLEAFALAIEDSRELLDRGFGHRVPLGWELDFTADQEPIPIGDGGYSQRGVLDGLLLTAGGEVEYNGRAVRSYFSAEPDAHSDLQTLTGDQSSTSNGVALPTLAGVWTVSGPPSSGLPPST